MSPPMSADERKAIDDRIARLEHDILDSRAEGRKSVQEGKLEMARNIAAIATATTAAEARDEGMAKDIHALGRRLHGVELEQAKQGASLTNIAKQTKRLEGWMPVIKLVVNAIAAVCAAYAAASAASHP